MERSNLYGVFMLCIDVLLPRQPEYGGVWRENKEDPGLSQCSTGQPPASGPSHQAPGQGRSRPDWATQPSEPQAAGTGLLRITLQAHSLQVLDGHTSSYTHPWNGCSS